MFKNKFITLVYLFFLMLAVATAAPIITDYHAIYVPVYNNQHNLRIAIRDYYKNNVPYFLVVNPYDFSTSAAPIKDFFPRAQINKKLGYYSMKEMLATPYTTALMRYTSPPYILQNYGVIHAETAVDSLFLTIDMCPSSKKFESQFFNKLVQLANKWHQPVPIAISVSRLWMIEHPQEFDWLIQQRQNNTLKITWINHTASHVYYPDVPLKNNFLLDPQTNVTEEILMPEKTLLENNQLPSVFFRFPGLISNKNLVLKLRKFGLIPLGSNAWLAKGQIAKPGDIILVHGNSNESVGIKKIMPLLQKQTINFLPLKDLFLIHNKDEK